MAEVEARLAHGGGGRGSTDALHGMRRQSCCCRVVLGTSRLTHLLAIDQGTTSTRAFLFDAALSPVGFAQLEFPQIFPHPGWVVHDSQGIWPTPGGIATRRETAITGAAGTGKPIRNAIVWQDRRTPEACAALARAGHE